MNKSPEDDFEALKRAWAPGRLSPPLKKHATILSREIEDQIKSIDQPGARQHFLLHGLDHDATDRLSGALMAQLRENHPELRIVRLNFQARIYGSIGGMFDSLISSITGTVLMADLADIAKGPIRKIWKDKIHDFLTVAMQPKDSGEETKGVVIFADDYDSLMRDVFDTPEKASYLRAFLQNQSNVIFIGVSKGQMLDSDADTRIFRLFRRWELPLPSPEQMFEKSPKKSPQFAALLATAQILGTYERPFTTAMRTLDWMDGFDILKLARALVETAQSDWSSEIDRLSSTRLAILQALVVVGEPATASELAQRLNVPQSRIARHIGDMKDEATLAVQSVSGRAKPFTLRERGLALAINGTSERLAYALATAVGIFLAHKEIDKLINQLIALPRSKRYAKLRKKWSIKAKDVEINRKDAFAIKECLFSAYMVSLVKAYQARFPDELEDLREAAQAQSALSDVLTELVDAMINPKLSSELQRAGDLAAYRRTASWLPS